MSQRNASRTARLKSKCSAAEVLTIWRPVLPEHAYLLGGLGFREPPPTMSRRNRPSFQEKTPLKGNSLRRSSNNFGRPTRSHGAARRPRRSPGDRRRAIPQTGRIPGPGPYGTTRIRKDSEAIAAVGQRAEDIDMHVIGRHFLSLEISPEPFTALLISLDGRPSDQI